MPEPEYQRDPPGTELSTRTATTFFCPNFSIEVMQFKGFGLIRGVPATWPSSAMDWFALLEDNAFVGLILLNVVVGFFQEYLFYNSSFTIEFNKVVFIALYLNGDQFISIKNDRIGEISQITSKIRLQTSLFRMKILCSFDKTILRTN